MRTPTGHAIDPTIDVEHWTERRMGGKTQGDRDAEVRALQRFRLPAHEHPVAHGPVQFRSRVSHAGPPVTHGFGGGAGTGPVRGVIEGNDRVIRFTFTSGTTPTSNATVVTFTFAQPKATTNYAVMLGAADEDAQEAMAVVDGLHYDDASRTTTTFTLRCGASPLIASTTYRLVMLVVDWD
jgi:hypothetical protein